VIGAMLPGDFNRMGTAMRTALLALSILAFNHLVLAEGTVSAVKADGAILIESRDGPISYKVTVDPKSGGDVSQLRLPATSDVVGRELNDLFFLGRHGEQYTMRGWTGREKFTMECSADVQSQQPDEAVVKVNLLSTGTVKVLVEDDAAKAELRKAHPSYKDKAIQFTRSYRFKPDRILVDDQIAWLHGDTDLATVYFTAAFMPGTIQGPARLKTDSTTASFYSVSSGGGKVPGGIAYPFTSENFLKSGYKVSLRTTQSSFDLSKSDFYFYEKCWQQDWHQVSGFMYRITERPAVRTVALSHEIRFAKADPAEMPPVITIHSPSPSARWMDEKGEVAPYKIGDAVKLSASAVNSDGSAVPDADVTWDVHVDPWWNTPSAVLRGCNVTYVLPEVTNEADKAKAKGRKLLAVIYVKAKGKNGTEAVEPFAMLVDETKVQ
jgi:hypothetical protein